MELRDSGWKLPNGLLYRPGGPVQLKKRAQNMDVADVHILSSQMTYLETGVFFTYVKRCFSGSVTYWKPLHLCNANDSTKYAYDYPYSFINNDDIIRPRKFPQKPRTLEHDEFHPLFPQNSLTSKSSLAAALLYKFLQKYFYVSEYTGNCVCLVKPQSAGCCHCVRSQQSR
ncbi:hypothetical protein CLV59_104183 [Chitinophaga dinghuensis]|uniref:Uncharacterized protein n=1 Tax=Chitinophaga dinghuensis TaxID=1539050 RepID=A0A327W7F4_9BACT|nr:hypothetical protein CLV59_104183 [Chitinophaga dinghuensis]